MSVLWAVILLRAVARACWYYEDQSSTQTTLAFRRRELEAAVREYTNEQKGKGSHPRNMGHIYGRPLEPLQPLKILGTASPARSLPAGWSSKFMEGQPQEGKWWLKEKW